MKQLFLGGISLGFHFYFFLAFGSLFRKILGRKEGLNRYLPLFTPVLGLFLYYGLFELLALPMTLLLVPLHVLTVVWGAALAAVGLAAAFLCGRDWVKSGKTLVEIFKKQPGIYLLAGVLVLGQMIYGVINGIREFFGLNAISFMTDPKYFRTIFIASNIWQGLGWGTIVYLAALSGVDPQLHEAATLDGANRWQRIRYVSWPAIVPTTTIMLILESGKIISSDFTKVLLLYNESTYETADIIGTYVYREGILGGKFEYTTAIGLLTSLFSFILLITANFLSKKISDNSLW